MQSAPADLGCFSSILPFMADTRVNDAIRQQAIDGIKRVTGDDGSTEMQSGRDQIALARYACSQAASASRSLGIRIMKVRTGDALGEV